MVELLKIMVTSFRRSHACTAALTASNPASGHHQPTLPPETLNTHRQVWVRFLWGHCSFLLGPGAHKFPFVPPRVCFPVLCKFWQLYVGVNGDLLQQGLCHTQVCCTQSLCPCSRPLLTHISVGDTQTQFWLHLSGISGSWCTQGLFEPSEHLWQVEGLILNMILPLLPSRWGFPFALGHGISPQSRSSAMQPLLQHCTATTPGLPSTMTEPTICCLFVSAIRLSAFSITLWSICSEMDCFQPLFIIS